MGDTPGWLQRLLGEDRAEFVVSVARDALALLIVVGLLCLVTWCITSAGQWFGDTVHLLPYITYAHEGIVGMSVVALIVRTGIDMWNFALKRGQ